MYGYVYLTTNLVNGKKYIGKHTSEVFDESYQGSGLLFLKAQKKYGKENFSTHILCECDSEEDLNNQEIHYIAINNAVEDDMYYNTSFGGTGNSKGLRTMYNAELDDIKMVDPSHIKDFKEQGYELGMRPCSDESRIRRSNAKSGGRYITNGSITKYIDVNDLDEYLNNGWWIGRDKPTRPNQKDEKRRWMNNGNKSIMVKSDEIQLYESKGFILGRLYVEQHHKPGRIPWNKGLTKETDERVAKYTESRRKTQQLKKQK